MRGPDLRGFRKSPDGAWEGRVACAQAEPYACTAAAASPDTANSKADCGAGRAYQGAEEAALGLLCVPRTAGGGRRVRRLRNHWRQIFRKSPLSDVMPHVLRHSFASIANDLGFTEVTIAALVGQARKRWPPLRRDRAVRGPLIRQATAGLGDRGGADAGEAVETYGHRARFADVLAGELAHYHAAATRADCGQKSDHTIIPDQCR